VLFATDPSPLSLHPFQLARLCPGDGALQFAGAKDRYSPIAWNIKTTVIDTANGTRSEASSKLNLIKRCRSPMSMPERGHAAIVLECRSGKSRSGPTANAAVRLEQTSRPALRSLRKQLAQHIGKTVAMVRMDGMGRVIEVLQGVANRYESELPFSWPCPPGAAPSGIGLAAGLQRHARSAVRSR